MDDCPKCGHPLAQHSYRHLVGLIGPVQSDYVPPVTCVRCGGKCTARVTARTKDTPQVLTGFSLIKDMNDAELIEELVTWQRRILQRMPRRQLVQSVMKTRLQVYSERLMAESGEYPDGPEQYEWAMTE